MNPSVSSVDLSSLAQRAEPPVISALMKQALEVEGLLSLAAGFTDNLALPDDLVTMALQHLRHDDPSVSYLQYGTTLGREGLRRATLKHIQGSFGETFSAKPEQVLITNGSQQALYLALQSLCDADDIVLVESPSYFVFLEMLTGMGVRALEIPTLPCGVYDLPALRAKLTNLAAQGQAHRLKAAYLISYFANPSGRCISSEEKTQLAHTLNETVGPIPILEDAAYRDLYFNEPFPAPSVLSLPAYEAFPKLYLGTFTKSFATGLKVGFALCSDPAWLDKLTALKGHQDFGTPNLNQAILETILNEGYYPQHLARIRPHYARKCALLDEALKSSGLPQAGWSWAKPEGGLLMWLRAPEKLSTTKGSAFCERALQAKVLYVPGNLCFGEVPQHNFVRLSFGAIASEQISEAVQRFAQAAAVVG